MRRLTYLVASAIDGFVAGPEGEYDFLAAVGDHMETVLAEYPETLPVQARGPLGIADAPNRRFDTVLLGRATYEVGVPFGVTSPYPHLRQYVVSGSMAAKPDPEAELVPGDPLEFVRELKRQDGAGVWLRGGGRRRARCARRSTSWWSRSTPWSPTPVCRCSRAVSPRRRTT
ncbi:dihydrofolate reductase family protein [Actinacidiphila glaucinigra]|uniref:dihydrofolate reductase family protein n=1 Tax=Actinacidiphila glaucinigra TaxID=235986 RepID=UPI0036ED9AF2